MIGVGRWRGIGLLDRDSSYLSVSLTNQPPCPRLDKRRPRMITSTCTMRMRRRKWGAWYCGKMKGSYRSLWRVVISEFGLK